MSVVRENIDVAIARLHRLTQREQEEAERRERARRKAEREQRIAQIRAEHARAFSEPLISADLLTDKERAEIRKAVKVGHRWEA